jgi:hypothetical protein
MKPLIFKAYFLRIAWDIPGAFQSQRQECQFFRLPETTAK